VNYLLDQFRLLKAAAQPIRRDVIADLLPLKWSTQHLMADQITKLMPEGGTILEVGCGGSLTLHFLSERGLETTGIDKSADMIEYSRYLQSAFSSQASFRLADAFNLPFADRSFDYVYSVGMIEHYDPTQQQQLVLELVRCSRRYVHLEIPNPHPYSAFFASGLESSEVHLAAHPGALLERAGCRIVLSDGRCLATFKHQADINPDYLRFRAKKSPELIKESFGQSDIPALIEFDYSASTEERLLYAFQLYWVACR
jgi:SAM-dependent methyltransferase